mmetsp:Transcript_14482/g.37555  ORF Transcript_14482/g.37555 Transcript_14482/m.37555 type:complete len:85 (+) Transcript_14482:523-777(+)
MLRSAASHALIMALLTGPSMPWSSMANMLAAKAVGHHPPRMGEDRSLDACASQLYEACTLAVHAYHSPVTACSAGSERQLCASV